MIALTHTHTQRELLITTLIKWAAVAAPAKRVIMAGISFIGGLLWQICFSSPHFQSLPGGQGDEDPLFFFCSSESNFVAAMDHSLVTRAAIQTDRD